MAGTTAPHPTTDYGKRQRVSHYEGHDMGNWIGRWIGRASAVGAGFVAALALAGTAFAHTEVVAEPAVGGSANALVSFSAAAESNSAGIKSVAVVLPAGIAKTDVTLEKGPTGWALSPTDDGFAVAGPALPKGTDAKFSIRVAVLPNVTELVFKTLVNYTNNTTDRWIGDPASDNPAPVLKLTLGADPVPTPTPTPTPTATVTTPPATAASTGVAVTPVSSNDGANSWIWWVVGAVVLAAGVAGALFLRRRKGDATGA